MKDDFMTWIFVSHVNTLPLPRLRTFINLTRHDEHEDWFFYASRRDLSCIYEYPHDPYDCRHNLASRSTLGHFCRTTEGSESRDHTLYCG